MDNDSTSIKQLTYDLTKEDDIEVAAVIGTKEDALAVIDEHTIDIVLISLYLAENMIDGLAATHCIHQNTSAKVIMLTSYSSNEFILNAFENGVTNYITKDYYEDVVQCIRDAYANHSSVHQSAAQPLLDEVRLRKLTETEKLIYNLHKLGLSKQQISDQLHRSTETVKTHLRSIDRKLNHKHEHSH